MTIAALPMYDWPEVSHAVDRLWKSVAVAALPLGLPVPAELTRRDPPESIWLHPELIVGQTCGLPLVQRLLDHVVVLGTFAFDLPDTDPGDYHSVVVVAESSPCGSLADLRGGVVAINARDSQSGHAALQYGVAPLAQGGRFFGSAIETLSHRASIAAVADGSADVAAIDAVSWLLALDHDPAAHTLRVLTRTQPTPGLPLITSLDHEALRLDLITAIRRGIAALDHTSRRALHIEGFEPHTGDDYTVIRQRLTEAEDLGYPTVA